MGGEDLKVVSQVADLRNWVALWRSQGLTVALVPTMGALHRGHLSLVEQAAAMADKVVVSIFVNPTQFAPGEDFNSYPRQLEADRMALVETGKTSLIFAPSRSEMYPQGHATTVSVSGISEGLCAVSRPHFFDGVTTIVSKLLIQCMPDVAVFGEKDYQQLQVIRRMSEDLDLPITIEGGAIVREQDGLAMSSRNAYLNPAERQISGQLNKIMAATSAEVAAGADIETACREGIERLLQAGFDSVDYLEVRRADDLLPLSGSHPPGKNPLTNQPTGNLPRARILAAVRVGTTRLIDNMPVESTGG